MKYFIEDTTLTNIADAVREKEESTQPIPVVELAGRIRDIQTGSTVGKKLNNDGTQNVFVDDTKGDTIDTGKPIASVKYNGVDVALVGGSGEIPITANGTYDVKKYASANVNVQSAPVLLWTNASIGVQDYEFAAQTLTFDGSWSAFIVEYAQGSGKFINSYWDTRYKSFVTGKTAMCSNIEAYRSITGITSNSLTFGRARKDTATFDDKYIIPTRIWGVKFTL